MGEKDQHDQVFVIEDFPGFFEGTTLSKLPPGALVAIRSIEDSNSQTDQIQISEDGEIRNSGFYSEVATTPGDVSTVSAIHYWKLPQGGDYLLVFREDSVYYLRFRVGFAADYITLPRNIMDSNRVKVSNQEIYGCFEEFGDSLYYADGLDYPLRIDYNINQLHPLVSRMGLADIANSFSAHMDVVNKPYLALNSRRAVSTSLYAVTFLTKYGESNASVVPISNTTPIESFPIPGDSTLSGSLSFCPVLYFDWQGLGSYPVYAVRIYRYDQLAGAYRLLVQLPRQSMGASTFVDTKSDGELGFPLPLDNAPPPRLRLLCSHAGRMFGVGGFENPNRVAFSKLGLPDVWPPQYELNLANLSSGDYITQIRSISGSMYLFLRNRILRMYGNTPEQFGFELVSDSVGCIAPRSMAKYQEGVVFLSRNGVHYFDGSYPKRISAPIYGLFERSATGAIPLDRACGVVAGDFYYLSYTDHSEVVSVSTTKPNRTLIVNLRSGRWGMRRTEAFSLACPYKDGKAFVADYTDSKIYLISDWTLGNVDMGGPILYFGHMDFGHPDQMKSLKHVEIVYESLAPITIELVAYREYPVTEPSSSVYKETRPDTQTPSGIPVWGGDWSLATDYYGLMHVWRANFNFDKMTGKSFSFSVAVEAGSPEIRIQKMICRYELEHREYLGHGVS